MSALDRASGRRVDPAREVRFTFDGHPVTGFRGDTIGSALAAAGRRVLSRSFKYHRPRGLFCCAGHCPNCLVAVDGEPGVRACTEPVREGMRVAHMNAWPSLAVDALRAADLVGGPLMPVGFYYKTFIRPRRLWPVWEGMLRRAAGLGRLPRTPAERAWRTDERRRQADVLVVGGGPAGLAAAAAAAELGADVVLVDDDRELGGHLLVRGDPDRAAALAERVAAAGVEIIQPAAALGVFDGLVPVWSGSTLHQVRAAQLVVAAGTIEQPLVFADNDLPGVMLAGGALRLARLYGVLPGRCAVAATVDDRGLEEVAALAELGLGVVEVADARRRPDGPAAARLAALGIPLRAGTTVAAALGRGAVRGARLAGSARAAACDLLLVSGGAASAVSLLAQAGVANVYDAARGRFLPGEGPSGVWAAGEVTGLEGGAAAEASGHLAGLRAARALGLGDEEDDAEARDLDAELGGRRPAGAAVPAACPTGGPRKRFVCLCEDVTTKEIAHAVAEGFDSIELAKRYTTVTMGPCQGRMCQLASIRLTANATGLDAAAVGTTRPRPPWTPVPLGALAGRPLAPARRSPMHGRHREAGAVVDWAGDWRRPYHYGDPLGEYLSVRDAVGLIDVSPLGKLLVQGPDAGAFLDSVYPNWLSNLAEGRIRYGVMTSSAGRIIDDGTVCRLGDEAFYLTTTSSNGATIEEWLLWWQAEWRLRAHVTNLTQAVAAMNLAGPRAREVMAAVTDIDCGAEAFRYLDARGGRVAGAPALALRIGFVGELGYEIHVPAALGEAVWDALLEAGAPLGIRRVGLEPQRRLRLEKLHVLVGQDTDSESTPYDAGLPWIVKLDKECDFVGRSALEHRAGREPDAVLVGLALADCDMPGEGAAVVVDGRPAGRVTSARHSPRLGHAVGLAWVPRALAEDGAEVTVATDGRRVRGTVSTRPFYDPDGERQRG